MTYPQSPSRIEWDLGLSTFVHAFETGSRGIDWFRRVRRLKRSAVLSGVPKKRRLYQKLGRTDPNIPDLLQREFSAQITEFPTGEGKLYLCVIKDLYDSTVVS